MLLVNYLEDKVHLPLQLFCKHLPTLCLRLQANQTGDRIANGKTFCPYQSTVYLYVICFTLSSAIAVDSPFLSPPPVILR